MRRSFFASGLSFGNLRIFGALQVGLLLVTGSVAAKAQSAPPADASVRTRAFRTAFAEPLIASGPVLPAEEQALTRSIEDYQKHAEPDDLGVFERFLADYPHSGYRVALLTNLGLTYYHYGYFSRAIDAYARAWKSGKDFTEPHQKAMVDRAVGELIQMHARLGQATELDALIREVGVRGLSGPATEELDGGKEGLWMMRNNPGVAYLCGPMALKNLLLSLGAKPTTVSFLDSYRSGPHGVTLEQVGRLAKQAKLDYSLIFREPGQAIPVPSIVHWKLNHFAAIVGREGERFHIIDPTFGSDLWVSSHALDAETSGYFLVPAPSALADWRSATPHEARRVYGMGYTQSNWPFATTVFDAFCQKCAEKGMSQSSITNPNNDAGLGNDTSTDSGLPTQIGLTGYKFSEMLVSLNLNDTPVGYAPPKGPPVYVTLTYNQREATQPSNFTFFNISPKWSLNWLSYVEDDPQSIGNNVVRAMAGGGGTQESGYDSQDGTFTSEPWDASVLSLVSQSPVVYTRQLPDGGLETYAQSDGSMGSTRRIFLTQITDPAGNSVNLNYDNQLRLITITDATGRNTTFSYNLSADPLLVTDITDPFNRTAHLSYDGLGRLSAITDVSGMTSQFSHDRSGLVNALVTPYGTTNFTYGDLGNRRFLQATDPLGHTERVEYYQGAPGIPFSDPSNLVPVGILYPFNQYLNDRDTFYWDEHAYAIAYPNYSLARNRHWTHLASNDTLTADTIESIKFPDETRIWHNYPGQIQGLGTAGSGTFNLPSRTGQVSVAAAPNSTSGGATYSTQLSQTNYNNFGHPTETIDPVGRETQFGYADNQIDLLEVSQKTAQASSATIAQYTYNSQHLPLTYTDAAGQTTHYQYNGAGQLMKVIDPLGDTTTYHYDTLGYLQNIIDANNKMLASFTYDQYGRVSTATDSEGYTVQYSYDPLDRITRETFPDTTTREYTWTALDLTEVKDRQNRTTHYTYDGARNLVLITDPLGRETHFTYWENGKLKGLTDPKGNTTTWDIDLENRVTAKYYADGSSVTYAYGQSTNRLTDVTDALGQSKHYVYALDNTVTGVNYLHAVNPTPNVSFTYDPYFRRVASMTDGTGTTQYQYFPPGVLGALQLQSERGPFLNATIAYQYDKLARLASRTVDSSTERFAYDDLGRVVSDTNDLGAFTIGYLGETSQISSRILQGSTISTGWVYDTNQNDRRLKEISNSNATRSFNFTTTPEDLITQIQENEPHGGQWPPQTWNYRYDDSNRLHEALGTTAQYMYGYDPADNITGFEGPWGDRSASYNLLNEITTFNNQSYFYDANGNLLDDGVRRYTWDAENRLIGVTSIQTGLTTTFRYDGLSRRISMVASGGNSGNYLWCGDSLCQARGLSDNVLRHYFSEGEYVLAGMQALYYSQDQLGSVRDVLLPDGSRAAASDYEPYGAIVQTSNGNVTDFRYARLFYDQQDQLYLASHRPYEGYIGRFFNRDPLKEHGGINLFRYADGDPIGRRDPGGEIWQVVIPAILFYLSNPNEANAPGPDSAIVHSESDISRIAGTLAGGVAGEKVAQILAEKAVSAVKCWLLKQLADYGTDKLISDIFEHLLNPDSGPSTQDGVDVNDPNWIPIGDGLYYYDVSSALGAQ